MMDPDALKSLEEMARELEKYPVDAFNFVREGLKYTVQKLNEDSATEQHITGRDLCWGLRDFALNRWGLLAPLVLRRWNISSTMDFGQIVFVMVEAGWMAKQDNDNLDDFRNVYDFRSAFKKDLTIGADLADLSDADD
jgi:uncharacterized repeat protein (TIGR04138 family)